MRVAVILLAFAAALASAQYQDGGFSPIPIRTARYQRLPARPNTSPQTIFANQRFRRPPVTFRPRPEDSLGISSYPSGRPIRPNLPVVPVQQIKPVSEEPEEDVTRERDDREDDRSQDAEEDEGIEESEENVPRTVGNIGSTGPSRNPANIPPQIQYRNIQTPPQPTAKPNTPPPPPVIQYRPSPKPTKPRKPIIEEQPFKQQIKPTAKPVKPSQYDARGKKPVAQIIRRYRNDNPDGSITWGFENDDGSYKEEVIGVDCITRGKYGYIDPDGIRREYTYETGIKCDEEQREEDEDNGFVDYQENKLVLPDGKTIDLSSMGKKQARRPRPSYGK